MKATFDGDGKLSEFIHNIYVSNIFITAVLDSLPVLLYALPIASIGSAALHDSSVQLLHQISNQFRTQMVALCTLTRGDLYRNPTGKIFAERFIDTNQRLRIDFFCEINC